MGGIIVAALLSLVAVMVYGIRGPDVFERLGVSLPAVVTLYFLAGIIGGAVVGLLLPLTTWRLGASLVGAVAASPLYVGAGLLLGHSDLVGGLVLAVLVGGGVGYGLWEPPGVSDPISRRD